MEDRLKTRFEWGLTADVQPPDFETRMAIIKRKAELVGLSVPDNVCEFIAQKLKSNIRQLEGTVKKLNAIHLVEGATPTISTAQRAISDIVNNEQPAPVTVNRRKICARSRDEGHRQRHHQKYSRPLIFFHP